MYEIFLNNRPVGTAMVKKEGLYFQFYCECILPKDDVFKVLVSDGKSKVKLGICVPEKGKFILKTRVPAKYLLGDNLYFTVESNYTERIPLKKFTPFIYLDKLETARLQYSDGQPFIIIS